MKGICCRGGSLSELRYVSHKSLAPRDHRVPSMSLHLSNAADDLSEPLVDWLDILLCIKPAHRSLTVVSLGSACGWALTKLLRAISFQYSDNLPRSLGCPSDLGS
jgi:hypothetical protein